MDTTRFIIQNVDLDECSEHETDPLGNSSFHDMMRVSTSIPLVPSCRVIPLLYSSLSNIDSSLLTSSLVRMGALQVHCVFWDASIKHLKVRIGSKTDALKKFKEFSRTLGQKVIDLKAKLSWITHQTNDLVKENVNLKSKVAALHEHIKKVKEKAIKEYQVS